VDEIHFGELSLFYKVRVSSDILIFIQSEITFQVVKWSVDEIHFGELSLFYKYKYFIRLKYLNHNTFILLIYNNL